MKFVLTICLLLSAISAFAGEGVCRSKLQKELPKLSQKLKDKVKLTGGNLDIAPGETDFTRFNTEYENEESFAVEVYILKGEPNGYYSKYYGVSVSKKDCRVLLTWDEGDDLDE